MTKNYSALHEYADPHAGKRSAHLLSAQGGASAKTFAILATDFGSVDASFTFEDKRYDTGGRCALP